MEEDLRWKRTFDGRGPLTEDDLWRKTSFDGRRPLKENNLWQVMAFDRWQTLTEDDIWWKTTSVRVFSILPEKNFTTPHLDSHSTTDPNFCLYIWSSQIPDKSDSPWYKPQDCCILSFGAKLRQVLFLHVGKSCSLENSTSPGSSSNVSVEKVK